MEEATQRGYFKKVSSRPQPLSLKPIPEDLPFEQNVFARITELVVTNEEKDSNKCLPKRLRKYAGIIFTLMASLSFSLCVLIVKILSAPGYQFSALACSFWRYLGILLPSVPLLLYFEKKQKVRGEGSVVYTVWPPSDKEKLWTMIGLLSRGIFGGASVILRYFALEYLTIGDTSVITYATPVLVTVMAHFCLGERMGVISVVTAIVTFGGVVAITRPPFITGQEEFDRNTLIGTSLACGSLICASLIVIITRKIRNVHFSLMTFVFGTIGTLQAFGLTQIFRSFAIPSTVDVGAFIGALMTLSFIGQMAIVLALKREQAGPVALVRSCDVIFGFTFQFLFLGVAPDFFSAIGALVVLSCVILTGVRKWVSLLPPDSKKLERLKFLLY